MKNGKIKLLAAAGVMMPQLALAHVGDHGLVNSFSQGFLHPILGLDHLLVLLAMGVLAKQATTQKAQLGLIASVIGSMLVGAIVGKLAGAISGMEALILGSAFVVAGTIWKARDGVKGSAAIFVSLSIGLVLFHGWAHGAELHGASLLQFIPGMLLSSLMLLGAGHAIAQYLPSKVLAFIVASSGVLLTVTG